MFPLLGLGGVFSWIKMPKSASQRSLFEVKKQQVAGAWRVALSHVYNMCLLFSTKRRVSTLIQIAFSMAMALPRIEAGGSERGGTLCCNQGGSRGIALSPKTQS